MFAEVFNVAFHPICPNILASGSDDKANSWCFRLTSSLFQDSLKTTTQSLQPRERFWMSWSSWSTALMQLVMYQHLLHISRLSARVCFCLSALLQIPILHIVLCAGHSLNNTHYSHILNLFSQTIIVWNWNPLHTGTRMLRRRASFKLSMGAITL